MKYLLDDCFLMCPRSLSGFCVFFLMCILFWGFFFFHLHSSAFKFDHWFVDLKISETKTKTTDEMQLVCPLLDLTCKYSWLYPAQQMVGWHLGLNCSLSLWRLWSCCKDLWTHRHDCRPVQHWFTQITKDLFSHLLVIRQISFVKVAIFPLWKVILLKLDQSKVSETFRVRGIFILETIWNF